MFAWLAIAGPGPVSLDHFILQASGPQSPRARRLVSPAVLPRDPRALRLVGRQMRVGDAQHRMRADRPPRRSRSPRTCSTSVRAPLDVAQHRGGERRALGRDHRAGALQRPARGAKPLQACDRRASRRAAPSRHRRAPAATMSPIGARIRQVMPATDAMNTHFSHISCMIVALAWPESWRRQTLRQLPRCEAWARRPARRTQAGAASFRCRMRPSASSVVEIAHSRPVRAPAPNRCSSRSTCRIPLSSGRIAVSGPTAGATDSIASSRSYALQLSTITSNGPVQPVGGDAGGAGRSTSPSLLRDRPARSARAAAARRGRTRNVTSRPACQQPAAEIAADRAGADNQDIHDAD